MVTESDIRVGQTYPYLLAPGLVTSATIVFERTVHKVRFVRYQSAALKLPGYSRASLFAKNVRSAMKGR